MLPLLSTSTPLAQPVELLSDLFAINRESISNTRSVFESTFLLVFLVKEESEERPVLSSLYKKLTFFLSFIHSFIRTYMSSVAFGEHTISATL